jgi:hypothetical protein
MESNWQKQETLTNPDKQENAPEFPGAFYVHLFLRVFPSWEPLMDHETSAIQIYLFLNFMKFPLNGQADQKLAYNLPPYSL